MDIIMELDQPTRTAYSNIEFLFLDNKLSWVIFIEAKFRVILQGDMTVTTYCHKLKMLACALHDVGQPVSDQALVLNTLSGLNPQLPIMVSLIPLLTPFLSFISARSMLLLAEKKLAHTTQGNTSSRTAMITVTAITMAIALPPLAMVAANGRRERSMTVAVTIVIAASAPITTVAATTSWAVLGFASIPG